LLIGILKLIGTKPQIKKPRFEDRLKSAAGAKILEIRGDPKQKKCSAEAKILEIRGDQKQKKCAAGAKILEIRGDQKVGKSSKNAPQARKFWKSGVTKS